MRASPQERLSAPNAPSIHALIRSMRILWRVSIGCSGGHLAVPHPVLDPGQTKPARMRAGLGLVGRGRLFVVLDQPMANLDFG
jgi:hypothetical protein